MVQLSCTEFAWCVIHGLRYVRWGIVKTVECAQWVGKLCGGKTPEGIEHDHCIDTKSPAWL